MLFARTIVGISGTIFFLWSLDKLLKLIPRLTFLAKFGTTTLGVYLLHEWPLVMVGKHFEINAMPVSVSLGLALALFFVCHYIVIFINSVSSSSSSSVLASFPCSRCALIFSRS